MEPTFLFVGRNDSDVALFREAVDDLCAAAVWEVSRALELLADGALAGMVVSDDVGEDSAERLITLARHVQRDLPIVFLGAPSDSIAVQTRVLERPLHGLHDALGALTAPRSMSRVRTHADVLVVDRDRRFLRNTAESLRSDGYAAATTSSEREARGLLASTRFKMVVLEVASIELARSVRAGEFGATGRNTAIVFLTDGDFNAAYEETFDLRALRCVVKPATGPQICAVVAGLLHDAAA